MSPGTRQVTSQYLHSRSRRFRYLSMIYAAQLRSVILCKLQRSTYIAVHRKLTQIPATPPSTPYSCHLLVAAFAETCLVDVRPNEGWILHHSKPRSRVSLSALSPKDLGNVSLLPLMGMVQVHRVGLCTVRQFDPNFLLYLQWPCHAMFTVWPLDATT